MATRPNRHAPRNIFEESSLLAATVALAINLLRSNEAKPVRFLSISCYEQRGQAMGRQVAQPARPQYFDDRLAYWAESIPEADALTYLDSTWTSGQWNDRVRRLAGALRDLGIRRGDVVSFLDKNHPACVDRTIAAASLGAANAIINFRLAGDEVDYAVNDSGAKVLIVGTELMPLVEK